MPKELDTTERQNNKNNNKILNKGVKEKHIFSDLLFHKHLEHESCSLSPAPVV